MNDIIHAGVNFGYGNIVVTIGVASPEHRETVEKAILFQVSKETYQPGDTIPDDVELVGEQGIQLGFKNEAAIDRLISDLQKLKELKFEDLS